MEHARRPTHKFIEQVSVKVKNPNINIQDNSCLVSEKIPTVIPPELVLSAIEKQAVPEVDKKAQFYPVMMYSTGDKQAIPIEEEYPDPIYNLMIDKKKVLSGIRHEKASGESIQVAKYNVATAAALSDPGIRKAKRENEDSYYLRNPSQESTLSLPKDEEFFEVTDGLGGHHGGKTASMMATHISSTSYTRIRNEQLMQRDIRGTDTLIVEALGQSVQEASIAIHYLQSQKKELKDMETTFSGFVLKKDGDTVTAYIANNGDSRTYIVREDSIIQITQDTSVVYSLFSEGLLHKQDIFDHPQRNLVYNTLGERPDIKVDITIIKGLKERDRLVTMSDGVWEMIRGNKQITGDQLIGFYCSPDEAPTPHQAVVNLLAGARKGGGDDNITALVAEVEPISAEKIASSQIENDTYLYPGNNVLIPIIDHSQSNGIGLAIEPIHSIQSGQVEFIIDGLQTKLSLEQVKVFNPPSLTSIDPKHPYALEIFNQFAKRTGGLQSEMGIVSADDIDYMTELTLQNPKENLAYVPTIGGARVKLEQIIKEYDRKSLHTGDSVLAKELVDNKEKYIQGIIRVIEPDGSVLVQNTDETKVILAEKIDSLLELNPPFFSRIDAKHPHVLEIIRALVRRMDGIPSPNNANGKITPEQVDMLIHLMLRNPKENIVYAPSYGNFKELLKNIFGLT